MTSRVPERIRSARNGPGIRPLDRFGSIKIKLGILVAATVTAAAFITWWGLQNHLGPRKTLPLAIVMGLVVTQFLARGMTSPLREMTRAVGRMATGDYSIRVTATSADEVGQLARAFNRMAEELGSVDETRREVLANVSHELRTPIAALQAQLENMVDGVTEPDPDTLRVSLAQTERLGRLVSYVLDLSRIEAGAQEADIIGLPVQPFFDEAVEGAEMVATSAGRDVHWKTDVTPRDLVVPADPERLHQVFANLLTNAARHSPPGGTITLTAHVEGDWAVMSVIDEGPGIAPQDRLKVFERFERGNAPAQTGSSSTGGTGLGLSIARWAVQLHGGTIEAADVPSGCTMTVRLPMTPPRRPGEPEVGIKDPARPRLGADGT